MDFIYTNYPLMLGVVSVVAIVLHRTAPGKQVLFLLREAIDTALEMAEGYNEQYRLEGEEDGDKSVTDGGKKKK